MNLYRELAGLTDAEAELCLNGVLKGLTSLQKEYSELFADPTEMIRIIQSVAAQTGEPAWGLAEVIPQERDKAVRLILVQMAEEPTVSVRLEAWMGTSRPTLLEPVTSAIVLAGIVLLLSTHIKLEFQQQNGKRKIKIVVEKKPTAQAILERFFPFFSK